MQRSLFIIKPYITWYLNILHYLSSLTLIQ